MNPPSKETKLLSTLVKQRRGETLARRVSISTPKEKNMTQRTPSGQKLGLLYIFFKKTTNKESPISQESHYLKCLENSKPILIINFQQFEPLILSI
jgi:hypothetical protein